MNIAVWLLVTLGLLSATPAFAGALPDGLELKLFGHNIRLYGQETATLLVDGKTIHTNTTVELTEVGVIGDYGYAMGDSGGGGNACDWTQFILVFPKSGPVRLDGPLPRCGKMNVTPTAGGLLFDVPATPLENGSRYVWKPESGFDKEISVPYHAESGRGWSEMTDGTFTDPAEIFSFPAITAELNQMLRSEKAQFQELLHGAGSVEVKDGIVRSNVCIAHSCPDGGSFYILDTKNRAIYLAWKPENQKIDVRPAVKQWPPTFRKELAEWAKGFQ